MITTDVVENAKSALTGTNLIEKAILTKKHRENPDEEKYPFIFWRIDYYTARVSSYENNKIHWNHQFQCDAESLEKAVMYAGVATNSHIQYDEVEVPEDLQRYWKQYSIIVYDYLYVKEKNGYTRERSLSVIEYWIESEKDVWNIDYTQRANNFSLALTKVPGQYYLMVEGGVPIDLSYHDTSTPTGKNIVGFQWRGYDFEFERFIPDQKALIGKNSNFKKYEDDNTIKIEVWDAEKIYEKNTIYIEGNEIYFNGRRFPNNYPGDYFFRDEIKKQLKSDFPHATKYESWFESGNL